MRNDALAVLRGIVYGYALLKAQLFCASFHKIQPQATQASLGRALVKRKESILAHGGRPQLKENKNQRPSL
jgi:hypothetical protein